MRRGRAVVALMAAIAAVILTGCTEQGPDLGGGQNPWTETRHATGPLVSFSGPMLGGGTFRSSAYRGKVLVVNFWFAACGPCQAEAGSLAALKKQYADQPVQFVGIDVRDNSAEAALFAKHYGVDYPVILDQANSAKAQLAFAGSNSLTVTPTTAVVGLKGRVTGTYAGEVDKGVLSTLISAAVNGRDS